MYNCPTVGTFGYGVHDPKCLLLDKETKKSHCAVKCTTDADCGAPSSGHLCVPGHGVCGHHPEANMLRATSVPKFIVSSPPGVGTSTGNIVTTSGSTVASSIGVPTKEQIDHALESGINPLAMLNPFGPAPAPASAAPLPMPGLGAGFELPSLMSNFDNNVRFFYCMAFVSFSFLLFNFEVREVPGHGAMNFDMFWNSVKVNDYGIAWKNQEEARAKFNSYPDPVLISISGAKKYIFWSARAFSLL